MKFRCFNQEDCPDWVLYGINIFSEISVMKLRAILNEIIQNEIIKSNKSSIDIRKLIDNELNPKDFLSAVTSIEFLWKSTRKYVDDSEILVDEFLQLGIPKEHVNIFRWAYEKYKNEKTLIDPPQQHQLISQIDSIDIMQYVHPDERRTVSMAFTHLNGQEEMEFTEDAFLVLYNKIRGICEEMFGENNSETKGEDNQN
ncbi:hypothetical protein SNEBB_000021 [Seison nebaliae]|nr:hypothetical protein SNEBB_000021 [Seison nebaliae]